ncbi:hypothetical protein HELRODRAFT_183440 [Helobdella robusta]|uniref:ADAM cysteine-rich domain-containing protein n=1 Tax=Helobdella robusta TaxID=6412 RepID=T1FJN6_HELRO|nr:hypothetical protein HELRODRAFT_183440 [Helobdella robusta]ESO11199.1 hypothetical protein HELRODRAFT_183440 [Helobdella robusta]
MSLLRNFCGILFFTLFGSFARTADDVVISFPSSLQLSLPIKNNAKYTVHLSREQVDAIDANVFEDLHGTQWHMNKLELVRNYGNLASFIVAKVIENGVLKTTYVGDFVHDNESYSMFPNTLEHRLDRKETLEEHPVVLNGVEYVVALRKPLPTSMNDIVLKPPTNTVYMNGPKLSNSEADEDLNRAKRHNNDVTELVAEGTRRLLSKWLHMRLDIFCLLESVSKSKTNVSNSLGSPHDEEEGNTCPARYRYIMTARYNSFGRNNHHTFSSCSREYFQNYAHKLDSIGQNCMLKSRTNSNNEDLMKHVNVLPRTKYSLDIQCQMLYGPNVISCLPKGSTNSSENSCKKFYCDLRNDGCTAARSNVLPGTPCGDKMWCLNERCVSNSIKPDFKENETTRKPDNSAPDSQLPKNWCIQDMYAQLCVNILKDEKSRKEKCNEFLYDCCKTCAPYVSGTDSRATSGRPDTSVPNKNTNPPWQAPKEACTQDKHAQWCNESLKTENTRKAYCKDYINSCCKTCAPYVSVRGISKFFKSNDIFLKSLWAILLLGCTTYLVYRLHQLLDVYYTYTITTEFGEKV